MNDAAMFIVNIFQVPLMGVTEKFEVQTEEGIVKRADGRLITCSCSVYNFGNLFGISNYFVYFDTSLKKFVVIIVFNAFLMGRQIFFFI